MRKIGACGAMLALAAIVLTAPPAQAFGLRIGPFHIGLPYFGSRHRHLYMRANPADTARPEASAGGTGSVTTSALVYPDLALAAIFQNIFWPTQSSPWPFGYQDIIETAFATTPAGRDQRACQASDNPNAIVDRLRTELSPTADQMPALQKLGGALGAASGYLAKSCPNEIPARPVARLKLMDSQLEELAMAVDIVRQPLQDFEQSLNDEQKARFAAMIEAPAPSTQQNREDAIARSCAGSPTEVDRSISRIDKIVAPTDAQRPALDDVKHSFSEAANDLEAHCPTAVPPTALGHLEAIQARLDATYRAVLAIQASLSTFETKLSDEQKDRFDQMNFAAR